MESRGRVHNIARGHAFSLRRPSSERDERLSGRDRDPELECFLLAHPVADDEGGPHRALGIVLVRNRRSEEGHHRIADELLDRPAVALELGAQAGVIRLEHRADILGVHLLGSAREADEVGEENGHDLALLACRDGCLDRERSPAVRAELRVSRVLVAALGAGLHHCNRSTT